MNQISHRIASHQIKFKCYTKNNFTKKDVYKYLYGGWTCPKHMNQSGLISETSKTRRVCSWEYFFQFITREVQPKNYFELQ